jgi:hypothetical protein
MASCKPGFRFQFFSVHQFRLVDRVKLIPYLEIQQNLKLRRCGTILWLTFTAPLQTCSASRRWRHERCRARHRICANVLKRSLRKQWPVIVVEISVLDRRCRQHLKQHNARAEDVGGLAVVFAPEN